MASPDSSPPPSSPPSRSEIPAPPAPRRVSLPRAITWPETPTARKSRPDLLAKAKKRYENDDEADAEESNSDPTMKSAERGR